jgi:hypothetical protein
MTPTENSFAPDLVEDNIRLLEQGLEVLGDMDAGPYGKAEPSVGLSGAGSHFRHLLDFYERFFEGLEAQRIDYDRRQRDPSLEEDPALARDKIEGVIARLRRLPVRGLSDRGLAPALLVKADAEGADVHGAPWAGSTVERELQVLMSHTVHHYALIAVALRMNGIDPGPEFGVAPSTLRYWKEQRACAR